MGSPRDRDPSALNAMTTPADRVARLAMDARHHLERRDLYRGKAGGTDAVSPERLCELEHDYELAAERLAAAESEARAGDRPRLRSVPNPESRSNPGS